MLCDVLEITELSHEEFIQKHPYVEISKVNKSDLTKSVLSQLEQKKNCRLNTFDQEDETNIIYRNNAIDDILHICSTVIS